MENNKNVPSLFNQDLDKVRDDCRDAVSSFAVMGGVNGLNPIPGVDVGIDAGLCLKMMMEIRERFGLNNAVEYRLRRYDLMLPLVKRVFDYATKEGVVILLKSMGKKYATKEFAKYIPLIGQGVAAAAGYGMMKYFGNMYIDDCYELAQKAQNYKTELLQSEG